MASINPPWRLDPLQIIVNISFGGPATFVAVDVGAYAQSSANTALSFTDPNPGTNYLGGYNVYSSMDGINWTINKQGVVDTNPRSFMSTTQVQAGYSYTGMVTLIFPFIPPATFTGTPYLGVISEGSGTAPLPPDFPNSTDTITSIGLPLPDNTSPPNVFPFSHGSLLGDLTFGIPGQDLFNAYSFFHSGFVSPLSIDGSWTLTNTMGDVFQAWNLSEPFDTLDGISEYMASSSVPLRVFVIGGNGSNGGSGMTVPFYYRSTDGKTWTQFTPPFNPADPWFPFYSDVWFDDGSQRTQNEHPGHFDGEPTLLWYSSDGEVGHTLYVSADGCVTWNVDEHHIFGNNPVTGNTDDVYIGDPSSGWYGEMGSTESTGSPNSWTTVYGDIGGHRMGVQVQATVDAADGIIHAGLASDDPSTWPAIHLPIPENAINIATIGSAFDMELYALGTEQLNVDLEVAQNQLAALQEALTWANGDPTDRPAGDLLYMVGEHNSLISIIEAQIAALPAPPTPRTPNFRPFYVAYAVPPGATEGIFVAAGSSTLELVFTVANQTVPVFWYSKDAVTWFVGNYDMTLTSDVWAVTGINYFVSGNPADQLFPETPS